MPSIRQAHLSDLPYIYDICHRTGYNGGDATDLLTDSLITGQYYAAPYLHYEIDTCFVVELKGIPYGYILGTAFSKEYAQWLNSKWLPKVRKIYPPSMKAKSAHEQFLIDTINQDYEPQTYLDEYPSHLHIDLLPKVQKLGLGKKLIFTLVEKLKEKGSGGLHLGVGINNPNAISFYKKIGFEELKEEPGSIWMGMRL